MTLQAPKPTKHPKSSSKPSYLSSHLAMIELKQRILTSISKLSDRDTHQIAVEDLVYIIKTLNTDVGVSMFLNCLYDASCDPKPAVKKESLRLFAIVSTSHSDSTSTHLNKIVAHIVKRLKDSDSSVRGTCCEVIGGLSSLYLRCCGGDSENLGVVLMLFVKPLFEAMGEQNKGVQVGAALCLARVVECAAVDAQVNLFQKLCPRICKFLNNQNFLAKAALLSVVASLSQVGALVPQSLPILLPTIHGCLENNDWATRKAAADTLSALASHSSHLIADAASLTINKLESCRFDKVKPARDSMTEAFQLWKKISEKGDTGTPGDPSEIFCDEKAGDRNSDYVKDKLNKKAPNLSDREWNAEFFQKLETQGSGDWPVEVAVPRVFISSTNEQGDEKLEGNNIGRSIHSEHGEFDDGHGSANVKYHNSERGSARVFNKQRNVDDFARDKLTEQRIYNESFSKSRVLDVNDRVEGPSINNSGNLQAIQRQLSQLERQQAHLMTMLQDFMGGSHDNMVTLQNRVRGLERIVEDMARDLTISPHMRDSNFMVGSDASSSRSLGMYNGFPAYSNFWQSDVSQTRGSYSYGASRIQNISSKRAFDYTTRSANNGDQVGNRRTWHKGSGPTRLGEGPSARSVWQASKDEATLQAIRGVSGDESGSRSVALNDDDSRRQDRDAIATSWKNAMNALRKSDMDTAFVEVLSVADDQLLVQLMKKSGPVMDQLSGETVTVILRAIGHFIQEQSLVDIGLSWAQQLVDLVNKNGPDVLRIPTESRKELLMNLHEASSAIDLPEDWEGAIPVQIMLQLASAWGIDMQCER
ncbi:hypothetical protein GIB67_035911 [Kingdonia uniflora]|uniref:TOG domain-containing protein n=1 Tax=Kingdonia uniflora TaxID=39325 RepID=A0A7J7P9G5_9MAGN|nr:hypothetical protein GIB67_035911 [Kingdonia uniflora]